MCPKPLIKTGIKACSTNFLNTASIVFSVFPTVLSLQMNLQGKHQWSLLLSMSCHWQHSSRINPILLLYMNDLYIQESYYHSLKVMVCSSIPSHSGASIIKQHQLHTLPDWLQHTHLYVHCMSIPHDQNHWKRIAAYKPSAFLWHCHITICTKVIIYYSFYVHCSFYTASEWWSSNKCRMDQFQFSISCFLQGICTLSGPNIDYFVLRRTSFDKTSEFIN